MLAKCSEGLTKYMLVIGLTGLKLQKFEDYWTASNVKCCGLREMHKRGKDPSSGASSLLDFSAFLHTYINSEDLLMFDII